MNFTKISFNYITNFKPITVLNTTILKKVEFKKNRIFCKNFLIFLLLMRYLNKTSRNLKIFVKPTKASLLTILRPPYRHKISRHQITIQRYNIVVSIEIKHKSFKILKKRQLIWFFKLLKSYYVFFETNICYLHKSRVVTDIFCSKFFLVSKYK